MEGSCEINDELMQMGSQLPRSIPGRLGTVPDLYFEELSNKCLSAIYKGAEDTFPIWKVSEKKTLEVPIGYFEQFPQVVLEAAKLAHQQHKTAKIAFPIKVQWAAAAMIAMVIILGGYSMFTAPVRPNPEVILATVPINDLSDYVANIYGEDVLDRWGNPPALQLQLTTEEIQAYVDERGWD